MLLVVFVGLSAAAVPLARGHLMNLARLRFRHGWLLLLAIGLQAPLILISGPRTPLREATYIASYLVAAAFLFENRRIPGIWLIGVGALMNLTAISANGGVMPASPHALAAAGLPTGPSATFINSMAVASPKIAFLGDIFAIPRSWPLSNVFSAGDICIALGSAVAIHRVSDSRLLPSGRGQFSPLFHRPTFMRLWTAQAVSNLGDWTYALAVYATLVERTHSPQALSFLLIAQVAPAAVFGGMLSALPDRHSRIKLMIGADLIRALAVGSLFIGHPSVIHIYGVAALLGIFGALFQPSLRACIPNVVEKDQVVAANAMVGTTFNFAIMAGPAIGGLLVAMLGPNPVFAINAMSFVLSASLIAGIRLPRPDRSTEDRRPAFRDLIEGARYSLTTPLVRGLLLVIGIVLVAAASKAPLESLFVLTTLSLGPEALGLIMGSWGLGMLLGSVAAPAVCRRWRRERVLMVMIVVVGACVLVAAQAQSLETVLLAWLIAGGANSIANVSYESVLQERTPDAFRGRVFAAFEFVTNVSFLTGAFLAGWLGTHLGVRLSYVFSGGLFLMAAVVCRITLARTDSTKVMPFRLRAAALARAMAGKKAGSGVSSDRPRLGDAVPAGLVEVLPQRAHRARHAADPMPGLAAPTLFPWQPQGLSPAYEPRHADGAARHASSEPVLTETETDGYVPAHAAETRRYLAAHAADWPSLTGFRRLSEPSAFLESRTAEDHLRAIALVADQAADPLTRTIVGALADPAPRVRRSAAEWIGRLRMIEALPALDHAVLDTDPSVRAAAVSALCQIEDDAILPALVGARGGSGRAP